MGGNFDPTIALCIHHINNSPHTLYIAPSSTTLLPAPQRLFPFISPLASLPPLSSELPSLEMRWGNPTTFLPSLPRDQGSLAPLQASDLIGYMEALKEMYMPPIHGGFTAADIDFETDTGDRKGRKRSRTLSGGSVDLPGLNLEMEGLGLSETIPEAEEDEHDWDEIEEEDDEVGYEDPFEREWAEKWLNGVVRRAQTWLEANEYDEDADAESAESKAQAAAIAEMEAVLRDATAVLALMAGTSAAGGLTRHLLFPLAPELAPALRALRPLQESKLGLSPETTKFLAKLSSSPASPLTLSRQLATTSGRSPTGRSPGRSPNASQLGRSPSGRHRPAALPVLLHDAPITDHISVGVQTWGSAILLGREMSLRPAHFGLFVDTPHGGMRVLELGAGTGLLSILCRKLLDLRAANAALGASSVPIQPGKGAPMGAAPEPVQVDTGLVVATDFHPDVLSNLRVCVDLNATPRLPDAPAANGIEIAKLDWCTFPAFMRQRATGAKGDEEELARWLDMPFDLVIASDCVYDPTHAGMIRDVAAWVVRPPGWHDAGGVLVSLRAERGSLGRGEGRFYPPSLSFSHSPIDLSC